MGQAVILLFLSRVFNVLNYVPAFSTKVEGTAMLYGTLLSFVLQAILILPVLALYRRQEGENVLQIAYKKAKFFGITLTICYCLSLLAVLIGSVVGFEYFMTNAVYPNAAVATIVISMCIVCFYCAKSGLEGLARTSTIVFIFFLLGTLFICLVSIGSVRLLNIRPILDSPLKSIITYALDVTSKSPEIYLLLFLFPRIKGSMKKTAFTFIIIAFLFTGLTNFLILSVLGEFGMMQTFPYFTLTSVVELPIFQRLDSIHMVSWVFISFIRITLYAIFTNYLLQSILPKPLRKFTLLFLFLITAIAATAVGYRTEIIKGINSSSAILNLLLTAVVPLILLIMTRNTKKRKEKSADDCEKVLIISSDTQ